MTSYFDCAGLVLYSLPGNMRTRMRIAHITTVHDFRDSRIFTKYCCSLASAGHEVHLVAVAPESQRRNEVQIHSVAQSRGPRLWRALVHVYRAAKVIKKLDRTEATA